MWDTNCLYQSTQKGEGPFKLFRLEMDGGVGTHIDAPCHLKKKESVDEIPIDRLIVPCRTLHVKKADENYALSLKEVLAYEARFGPIEEGDFFLLHTGWDRFWDNPKAYINNHKFPSISADAAHYLAEKKIVGLGIDTLSPDRGDTDFPVHHILLSKNIYIVENVAHAEKMPSLAAVAILPLKGKGLAEAPVRMVGIITR